MATQPVLQRGRELLLTVGKQTAGQGIAVNQNLRVQFEITKTITSAPNTAEIRVFNLSQETENKIEGEFDEVILNAGYKDHSLLIFAGNIRYTKRFKDGNDWITQIIAADGDQDTRDAIVNTTFAKGASNDQVVDHLLSKMPNTSKGHIVVRPHNRIRGVTLTGMVRKYWDQIARDNDAHWSIQDGVLVCVPVASTLPDEAIVIRADTGMTDPPEIDDKGIKVTCFLNPQIRVNGKLQLDNNDLKAKLGQKRDQKPGAKHKKPTQKNLTRLDPDGVYKVYKLVHKGDTRDTEWKTEAWCVGLDKAIPSGTGAA